MAIEKRGTITITAKADTSQLEQMNTALGRMEEQLGKVGASLSGLALNQITDLFSKLKSSISLAVGELEQWNLKLATGMGPVRGMVEASGHMIGALDAVRARTILTRGDFKASEGQMEALVKASVIYARTMKVDVTEALNTMADAALSGRGAERALRMLGISVNLVGDESQKGAQYLEVLEARMQNTTVAAKTKGDQLKVLTNQLRDFTGELWTAVKASSAFQGVVGGLIGGIRSARVMASGGGGIGGVTAEDVLALEGTQGARGTEIGAKALAARLRSEARIAATFGGLEMGDEESPAAQKGILADPLIITSKRRRGGAGRRRPTGPGFWGTFEDEFKQVREGRGDFWGSMSGDYDSQWSASERYGKSLQRGQAEQIEKVVRAAEQEADANEKRYAAWKKVNDITAAADKQMKDMAVGSLASFSGGIWAAADAAIQGGESMGAALGKMLKATLLSIAQQSTVKAIFELAEGFAAIATYRFDAATAHFTASGIYGATAAIAGAAGLAMSAAGVGASPGGNGAGASASSGGGSGYRPQFGSESRKKEQPIIVKVVFDRSDPAAESFARRQVRAQLEAA